MSWNWCQPLGKHDFWAKFCSRAKIAGGAPGAPPHTWRALSDVALARVKVAQKWCKLKIFPIPRFFLSRCSIFAFFYCPWGENSRKCSTELEFMASLTSLLQYQTDRGLKISLLGSVWSPFRKKVLTNTNLGWGITQNFAICVCCTRSSIRASRYLYWN